MSLIMTQFVCIRDFVVGPITRTFLGSGSVEIALQRGGQCDDTASGVERLVQKILLLPPLGMLENKEGNKGPLCTTRV